MIQYSGWGYEKAVPQPSKHSTHFTSSQKSKLCFDAPRMSREYRNEYDVPEGKAIRGASASWLIDNAGVEGGVSIAVVYLG